MVGHCWPVIRFKNRLHHGITNANGGRLQHRIEIRICLTYGSRSFVETGNTLSIFLLNGALLLNLAESLACLELDFCIQVLFQRLKLRRVGIWLRCLRFALVFGNLRFQFADACFLFVTLPRQFVDAFLNALWQFCGVGFVVVIARIICG